MRLPKLLAIPMLALMLTGCFKDDLSKCYDPDNVTVRLTYSDAGGAEFNDYIDEVDLFLFDADGKYLLHRKAAAAELTADPSMTFTLEPGTYYALAWGNVGDCSAFCSFTPGVTTLDECLIQIEASSDEAGDRIYYAPHKEHSAARGTRAGEDMTAYKVVVPPQQNVVKILDFVRAHRSVYVWMQGFDDAGGLHPTVEAKRLWSAYDFHFRTLPDRRDYSKQSAPETAEGVDYSLASFHHAFGEIDEGMDIDIIRTSDGSWSHTVNLKQFLTENPASDTEDIHILLTFRQDLGVTITLPAWSEKPIAPGIK